MPFLGRSLLLLLFLGNILCYSQIPQEENIAEKPICTEENFSLEYMKAFHNSSVKRMEFLVKNYPYWAAELVQKIFITYLSLYYQKKFDMSLNYLDVAKTIVKCYEKEFNEDIYLKQLNFYENLSDFQKKLAFYAIRIVYRADVTQDAVYLFSIDAKNEDFLNDKKITKELRKIWDRNNLSLSDNALVIEKTEGQDWTIQDKESDIIKNYFLLRTSEEIVVYHTDLYKEAIQILQKIGDDFQLGVVFSKLGEQSYIQKQYLDMEKFYLQAMSFFEKISDVYNIAKSLNSLGLAASLRKNYSFAFSCYEKAQKILEKKNYPKILASILKNLGILEKEQKNYIKAKEYFEESLKIYSNLMDTKSQAEIFSNLGLIAYLEQEYPRSIEYLEKSAYFARHLSNTENLMSQLGLLADANIAIGNYKKTQSYLEERLDIAKTRNNTDVILDILCDLAKVSVIQGEKEKAKQYYQDKLSILKSKGDIINSKEIEAEIGQLEYKQKFQYFLWGSGILIALFSLRILIQRIGNYNFRNKN